MSILVSNLNSQCSCRQRLLWEFVSICSITFDPFYVKASDCQRLVIVCTVSMCGLWCVVSSKKGGLEACSELENFSLSYVNSQAGIEIAQRTVLVEEIDAVFGPFFT